MKENAVAELKTRIDSWWLVKNMLDDLEHLIPVSLLRSQMLSGVEQWQKQERIILSPADYAEIKTYIENLK